MFQPPKLAAHGFFDIRAFEERETLCQCCLPDLYGCWPHQREIYSTEGPCAVLGSAELLHNGYKTHWQYNITIIYCTCHRRLQPCLQNTKSSLNVSCVLLFLMSVWLIAKYTLDKSRMLWWIMPRTSLIMVTCLCISIYLLCLSLSALYPAAHRVRRETAALVNPVFQKSIKDADLLYEVEFLPDK